MIGWDNFALIMFCIIAETISVLCFKRGVDQDESNPVDTGFIWMVLTKPLLWMGIFFWGVELIAWVIVLEHTPLSIAFPIMSLVYCSVPLAGKLFLGEKLPSRQWLATMIIASGVALVGSTGV